MSTLAPMAERAAEFRKRFADLEAEIGQVIVGQPEIVRGVLTGPSASSITAKEVTTTWISRIAMNMPTQAAM